MKKPNATVLDKRVVRWMDAYRALHGKEPPEVLYVGRGWWEINSQCYRVKRFEEWAERLEINLRGSSNAASRSPEEKT